MTNEDEERDDDELDTLGGDMFSATHSAASQGDVSASSAERPPRAGRFICESKLGKGGQGEVWLARDPELGRKVALKVLSPSAGSSSDTVTKFRLEAEVTGKLEHPNIVPIYEAGLEAESSDAPPWYVMRVVGAQNLAAAIAEFHEHGQPESALRRLLGHFVDVCNAIAFAHDRAVLHRDLKPQNVMLGRFGETLVVDWGLAKVIDGDALDLMDGTDPLQKSTGGLETAAGSVVGTPAYMAPEQARGEIASLGPATDVYSLGATLYCLLTNRPPVTQRPVLENVRLGRFPRPRSRNPLAPKALEAICLKALSHNPADRYPTATALAADVTNWLDSERVTAWSEPFSVSAARFIRKRPSIATAFLMAMAMLVVISVVVVRSNRSLNKEKMRGDENLGLARKVLDHTLVRLSDDRMQNIPFFDEERQKILEESLDFYEQFRRSNSQDPKLQLDVGETYDRIGRVLSELSRPQEAEAAFKTSRTILQDLARNEPDNWQCRFALAETNFDYGAHLAYKDEFYSHKAQLLNQARTALEKLATVVPLERSFELRAKLAEVNYQLATTYKSMAESAPELAEDSDRHFLAAKRMQQEIYKVDVTSTDEKYRLGRIHNSFAWHYYESSRFDDCRREGQAGVEIFDELVTKKPNVFKYQSELFDGCAVLCLGAVRIEDWTAAIDLGEKALEVGAPIARQHPNIHYWQQELADIHLALGNSHFALDELEKANSNAQQAEKLLRQVENSNVQDTEILGRLEEQKQALGIFQRKLE